MDEQTNWLNKELETMNDNKPKDFEKLEPLTLEEGTIVTFTVDFTEPFNKWIDEDNATLKKIIPVTHYGIKKNWWLNVKNPIYHDLIERGTKGETVFNVKTEGKQKNTRYFFVDQEEDKSS